MKFEYPLNMRLLLITTAHTVPIVNGRNQVMVIYFDRLMAGNPNNTNTHFDKGVILSVDVNDKQEALEDFNDALFLEPDSTTYYF